MVSAVIVLFEHEYAVTGNTEQVLSIVRSHGVVQLMLPVSVTIGLLVELTDARFGIDAQAVKLVAALNTMVFDALAAMSPKLQLSTCGLVPLIAQPFTTGVSAQVTPPPSGSVSVSVTLLARPVPVLVTTIVNVAVSPALIVCPSGVLTTVRLGA